MTKKRWNGRSHQPIVPKALERFGTFAQKTKQTLSFQWNAKLERRGGVTLPSTRSFHSFSLVWNGGTRNAAQPKRRSPSTTPTPLSGQQKRVN